jgi:hypothetical protein
MLLMEGFSMIEQQKQESNEVVAQSPRKRRSREEKIGRLKYNQYLLKRVLTEISEVRETQRIILNGLKAAGYFHFDVPWIQKKACQDQFDLEIMEIIHKSGRGGVLPKDVAAALSKYKDQKGQPIKHYHVSRRIQRMNKRLKHANGELLFEKRGQKWAFTQFAFESYGDIERHSLEEFPIEPQEPDITER